MSLVAFTFGSFGDIATLADLALKIGLALNDCAGTLSEFKALVVEIESFAASMLQIKESLSTRSSLSCALTLKIGDALDVCFDLLKRVQKRIDKFNKKTATAVGKAVLRKYWAVVGWEILGGRDEVEKLRYRLSLQVNIVNALLSASARQDVGALHKQAVDHQQDVRRHLVTLEKRLSGTSLSFQFFDADGCTRSATSISPRVFLCTSLSEMLPETLPRGIFFINTCFRLVLKDTGDNDAEFFIGTAYFQNEAPVLGLDGEYHLYAYDPNVVCIVVSCAVRVGDDGPTEVLISPAYAATIKWGPEHNLKYLNYMSPSASAGIHAMMLRLHSPDPESSQFLMCGEDHVADAVKQFFNPRELVRAPAYSVEEVPRRNTPLRKFVNGYLRDRRRVNIVCPLLSSSTPCGVVYRTQLMGDWHLKHLARLRIESVTELAAEESEEGASSEPSVGA